MDSVHSIQSVPTSVTFDGPPIPVGRRYKDIPFPVESLPEPFAAMVTAVAEATQTDPAMAGVSCLTVLAAAAGGAAEVEIRPGWRELLCLFTVTVAAPGERKSAVQAMLSDPVVVAEETLAASSEARRTEADTIRQIAGKDAERARLAASSAEGAAKDRAKAEAISLAMMAEAMEVPPVTRLIADDVTPEAAASLIAEQKRLAIISAEGGILDIIAGRYSGNVPNLDLFLKGHAGDRLRVDRKGRDPEYVKRPALTLGLMVQPSVLEAIGQNRQFRGRGLLARFLYSAPASYVGRRNSCPASAPGSVRETYAETLGRLVVDLAGWVGDPATIALTPEAHESVVRISEATEVELGDDGVLYNLKDWGSKYVGAVVRIAGLLHLAEHGSVGVRTPITPETVLAALRIGTYFKSHAVRAFDVMQTDQAAAEMTFVLDRILRTGETELSERDIHRETRSRFHTADSLRPVLANLVDRNYLMPLPEPEQTGRGRPRSRRFALHPKAGD